MTMTDEPTNTVEPCPDCPDDPHFGATGGSVSDAPWNGAASRYTDEQYKRASAACDPGDAPPKTACFMPHHEPSGAVNRNGVHAAAQRAGQLKGHDAGAVARAKAHLRAHYMKDLDEDPPESISASASTDGEEFVVVEPIDGQHSHEHADDQEGPVTASGVGTFSRAALENEDPGLPPSFAFDVTADDPVALFASALVTLGSPMGVRHLGESWSVITASGDVRWSTETYEEAVARIGETLQTEERRPVLAQGWRSEMAFEERSTGDGRRILAGGITYRDCPLPLMLQTETAPGHEGAVLAGAIEQTGKLGFTGIGSGSFDDSPAGRQSVQIIEARDRFGVSIDVAEAEGEAVCTEPDGEDGCKAMEVQFSMVRVMGLTLTPFPAFADAFIEMAPQAQPVAASGSIDSGIYATTGGGSDANTVVTGGGGGGGEITVIQASTVYEPPTTIYEPPTTTIFKPTSTVHWTVTPTPIVPAPMVAAGGPVLPPADWFADPKFGRGDPRLVRQPDGQTLCPLTVTDDGQVFGHMFGWKNCHTGIVSHCMTPPRSASNYAYFNRRPIPTAEGETVHVGILSMGCGHAGLELDWQRAQDHYDGGPGAVQMADVHVGSDAYGAWFAGSLRPGLSDAQVRAFRACSVSGDWREIQKGRGLDLLACLAGVTAPGFVVTSMAAAGELVVEDNLIGEARSRILDGRVVALVAAGVVRQPDPWERSLGVAMARIEELEHRLAKAEVVTRQLRGDAASRLLAGVLLEAPVEVAPAT